MNIARVRIILDLKGSHQCLTINSPFQIITRTSGLRFFSSEAPKIEKSEKTDFNLEQFCLQSSF